jgi:hypothetical protein
MQTHAVFADVVRAGIAVIAVSAAAVVNHAIAVVIDAVAADFR